MKRSHGHGFTIVELLIVIVVIALLAAITIVAYNGIQQRARDAERSVELGQIQKALEMYHADNGAYPKCNTAGPNNPPTLSSGAAALAVCLADDLVPTYLNSMPLDPVNSGSRQYLYAAGYTKNGLVSFVGGTATDNYILGVKQDSATGPVYAGWGYNDLTLLLGSSN